MLKWAVATRALNVLVLANSAAYSSPEVSPLLIPHDCVDGFLGAYWRRPQAYLEAGVRSAISTFSKLRTLDAGLARLQRDIADGTWTRRYGDLLGRAEIDLGYRLIVAPKPPGVP